MGVQRLEKKAKGARVVKVGLAGSRPPCLPAFSLSLSLFEPSELLLLFACTR